MDDKVWNLGSRGMYFRRDGTPYTSILEFAKDFETWPGQRRIAETRLWWGGRVSTVWLGFNHNFLFDGPPLIFETMVFAPRSLRDLDMDRYSTEAQAVAGHQAMVRFWSRSYIKIAWTLIGCSLEILERFIERYGRKPT